MNLFKVVFGQGVIFLFMFNLKFIQWRRFTLSLLRYETVFLAGLLLSFEKHTHLYSGETSTRCAM